MGESTQVWGVGESVNSCVGSAGVCQLVWGVGESTQVWGVGESVNLCVGSGGVNSGSGEWGSPLRKWGVGESVNSLCVEVWGVCQLVFGGSGGVHQLTPPMFPVTLPMTVVLVEFGSGAVRVGVRSSAL